MWYVLAKLELFGFTLFFYALVSITLNHLSFKTSKHGNNEWIIMKTAKRFGRYILKVCRCIRISFGRFSLRTKMIEKRDAGWPFTVKCVTNHKQNYLFVLEINICETFSSKYTLLHRLPLEFKGKNFVTFVYGICLFILEANAFWR